MGNAPSYPASRVVQTTYGAIRGRRLINKGERQVDAFQGVPYAKPPIGELRFEKPQPPDKWSGIKETKNFAKRAIQAPIFFIDHYLTGFPSEDCLYLNVFTPCWDPPQEGFPVMVFIHGGGFQGGETDTFGDVNICENIVTRDVIFVTLAYRLGYLGFFTTGDDVCPGNFGLWDQIAALRWVNENIEAFGGNKNNITLLGQSAGAVSTDMLHLSPHSTGLFHKMIVMAGTADIKLVTGSNMQQQCREKVTSLGIFKYHDNKKLLDKLRTLPADKFAVKVKAFKKNVVECNETVPNIHDLEFFPASFDQLRKTAVHKPLMTGVTKEEGAAFLIGKKPNEKKLSETIKLVAGQYSNHETLEIDLRSLYASDDILKSKENTIRANANILSDYHMNADILELCRKTVANQNKPVYLYVFDHVYQKAMGVLSCVMPIKDATHASELIYLFKIELESKANEPDDDTVVLDTFTTAFTNFAKFGNPNGADDSKSELPVEWTPTDKSNCTRNFVFSAKSHMDEQFFEGRPAKYLEILDNNRELQ